MSPMLREQERATGNPVTVKIITMGQGITNYVADEPLTLGQLLDQIKLHDMDVRVNGATVDQSYRLGNADEVLVVPKIRGGRR